MEIIQERLSREFDLNIIATAPSVIYDITKKDGTKLQIQNPGDLPKETEIEKMEEPIVEASIITPKDYVGIIMEICQNKRGEFINVEYLDEKRATVKYLLPLNEVIYDFFDTLKSKTRGYASFDYEIKGYKESDLVKLDILINGQNVDALTLIVHRSKAYERARMIVEIMLLLSSFKSSSSKKSLK